MDERQTSLTIAEALLAAMTGLRKAGLPEPRREANSLLMHATGRDHAFLITHADDELTAEQLSIFRDSLRRRAAGEPFQYIAGRQEFYGLEFEVTPDVLIPRPETELLVEAALELLKGAPAPHVCDVGTGSGCVAVTLLHERRDARGLALDISPAALAVAARNAARHGVGGRLRFLVSDCFDALGGGAHEGARGGEGEGARGGGDGATRFDLVASNPPYIAEDELAGLQKEVRDHEPRVALTPGGDGLGVVRRLVREAPAFLKPGGHLLVEIGFGQDERVRALVDPAVWTLLDIRRDLQGIPRTVVLRLRAG